MKRSDLELIQRYFANTRPDLRTAPVVEHTEWRRIVTAIGAAFAGSPWAHLHDHAAWLNGTGADVREPAPSEGAPFEVDGAWYNLTESEATSRGLIRDPSEPCYRVPRNLDSAGVPYHDAANRTIMDAVTGEWRGMTPSEVALYPAPPPVDLSLYADAREGDRRTDYCRVHDSEDRYVCTCPRGHEGLHAAAGRSGALLRSPWSAPTPTPPAARAAPTRSCGDEYADDDGDFHTCTEVRGHDDEQSSRYAPDIAHSDGDVSW